MCLIAWLVLRACLSAVDRWLRQTAKLRRCACFRLAAIRKRPVPARRRRLICGNHNRPSGSFGDNIMRFITRRLPIIGSALLFAAALGLTQAATAGAITRVFVVEVPPAQDQAFNQGMKSYEKCLRDHGATHATYVYDAETGDVGRYLFLEDYSAWGGMDVHSAAGKACHALFGAAVLPHFSHAFSEVAELNAKDTYMPGGDADPTPIMWVEAYRIKPGQADNFRDALGMLAAAAAKAHWQGHFAGWDIDGAGQGGEDFVLVWPNRSWADVGQEPSPSAKDLMSSAYGKAAAVANHQKFLGAIAEDWSDAWSYDKGLSFIPAK